MQSLVSPYTWTPPEEDEIRYEISSLGGYHTGTAIKIRLDASGLRLVGLHEEIHDRLLQQTLDGALVRCIVMLSQVQQLSVEERASLKATAKRLASDARITQETLATYLSIKGLPLILHDSAEEILDQEYRLFYKNMREAVDTLGGSSYVQGQIAWALGVVALSTPTIDEVLERGRIMHWEPRSAHSIDGRFASLVAFVRREGQELRRFLDCHSWPIDIYEEEAWALNKSLWIATEFSVGERIREWLLAHGPVTGHNDTTTLSKMQAFTHVLNNEGITAEVFPSSPSDGRRIIARISSLSNSKYISSKAPERGAIRALSEDKLMLEDGVAFLAEGDSGALEERHWRVRAYKLKPDGRGALQDEVRTSGESVFSFFRRWRSAARSGSEHPDILAVMVAIESHDLSHLASLLDLLNQDGGRTVPHSGTSRLRVYMRGDYVSWLSRLLEGGTPRIATIPPAPPDEMSLREYTAMISGEAFPAGPWHREISAARYAPVTFYRVQTPELSVWSFALERALANTGAVEQAVEHEIPPLMSYCLEWAKQVWEGL